MNNSTLSVNSLLSNLKSLVELLIQFQGDSLTRKYGAIERLRAAILEILSHGLKQTVGDLYEQLWQLIVRLNANSQRYIHLLQEIYHKENIRFSVEQWIDQSVISQCLSEQIRCANVDPDLLCQYYHSHAFMRIQPFYQAFIVCLQTVEQSDPTLLLDIDPKLCLVGFAPTNEPPMPTPSSVTTSNETIFKDQEKPRFHSLVQQNSLHRRIHSDPLFLIPKDAVELNRSCADSPIPTDNSFLDDLSIKQEDSIPSMSYSQTEDYSSYPSSYDSRGGETIEARKEPKLTLGKATNSEQNRHSISSQITLIDEQDQSLYDHHLPTIGNNDETSLSIASTSPRDRSATMSTVDYSTRTTSTNRLPYSTLLWPRKGQTLDNYIRECDLKTRTDVEKENAHFYFSEAIISAIEQIKFTQQCSKHFGQSWSSSVASVLSPCETTHISSSSSSSSPPPPAQQYLPCNPKLIGENHAKNGNMDLSQSDLNSEMVESTTDSNEPPNNFDWSTRTSALSSSFQESSAEAIALGLIEAWKNHKVPTGPELFWMIPHDADLPQEFLPLPDGVSIDPSEDYLSNDDGHKILCRGNNQWAPPREQLIFHIHPPPNRDVQLRKQGYLCAGCGRHVEKGFASRYRYCEYTGKFFCRICHSDKQSFLPSYIINKWDFSNKHSVSNFASAYLNRIYTDASFNLNDLNPKLYEKNKQLKTIDDLRWILYYLRNYILPCRFAGEKGCREMLQKLPSYVYMDPYMYSLQDLFKTKSGDLIKVLEPVVVNLREHVLQCPLCSAQGFICEICMNRNDIIFPFDLERTSVCQVCQACFHYRCHENRKYQCPKCQRNKSRTHLPISTNNGSNTPTNTTAEEFIIN